MTKHYFDTKLHYISVKYFYWTCIKTETSFQCILHNLGVVQTNIQESYTYFVTLKKTKMYNKRICCLSLAIVFAVILMLQTSVVQGQSAFQSTRPATLFEPTLSFMRQNIRLVTSYVALFRSIFVGAYERPLVTSTDPPPGVVKVQPPKVPPMDLPERNQ